MVSDTTIQSDLNVHFLHPLSSLTEHAIGGRFFVDNQEHGGNPRAATAPGHRWSWNGPKEPSG